jgi:SNF2 family DNA or RNA helicase
MWPDFQEYYERPIKRAATSTANREAILLGRRRQADLNQTTSMLMLRRTKEEVLHDVLVGKLDQVVFCQLSPLQV